MASPWKADRVRSATTTIFAEMSALALSTGSINLGQGFPDTDGPDFMLETARQAIADGINQYPPGRGIQSLRQAVVDHTSRHYGLHYDADLEVLVTTGATEALAAAILAFVNPGDEVVALEPFYDSYAASIDLAGGTRVGVGLFGPDFVLDLAEFERAFTAHTKMVLINSPHNPTGAVLPPEQLAEIARICVDHDVLVVCDEVYEHLVYDDATHVPLASYPGMRERTVRISSSGKTFSATGWKIGWALAPAELITEITAVKQFLTYVSGAPFQPAIARALNEGDDWVAELRVDLQRKRDLLAEGLRSMGLSPALPRGTYFMTTDVRPLGYHDGLEFCRELPGRCGVVAIPHQVFYDNTAAGAPYVRWAFCKRDEVLEQAVERLAKLG
ncbi:pyridoxal phosphate-dependent aminotransferase [Microlunatus panaciterrae]|uniref:N-succinyldiaminopimelate aminotransferase n=1 Tax=Microlunatus panaciterrae TaxID=400768 RepID=A0ABS2RHU0_9ACTN|nr:pyridoxal phosphate-dependent aminotransferase [Microlunatus panaciterrae]MBM7798566.1 N-succinyldiaminopimelate aminotransferase [Microlunatus panaciterrae]